MPWAETAFGVVSVCPGPNVALAPAPRPNEWEGQTDAALVSSAMAVRLSPYFFFSVARDKQRRHTHTHTHTHTHARESHMNGLRTLGQGQEAVYQCARGLCRAHMDIGLMVLQHGRKVGMLNLAV